MKTWLYKYHMTHRGSRNRCQKYEAPLYRQRVSPRVYYNSSAYQTWLRVIGIAERVLDRQHGIYLANYSEKKKKNKHRCLNCLHGVHRSIVSESIPDLFSILTLITYSGVGLLSWPAPPVELSPPPSSWLTRA